MASNKRTDPKIKLRMIETANDTSFDFMSAFPISTEIRSMLEVCLWCKDYKSNRDSLEKGRRRIEYDDMHLVFTWRYISRWCKSVVIAKRGPQGFSFMNKILLTKIHHTSPDHRTLHRQCLTNLLASYTRARQELMITEAFLT